MFEQPTTIILGAGASQQFGFPIGRDLQAEIIRDISKLEDNIKRDRHFCHMPVGFNNAHEFFHQPLATLCSYLNQPLAGELITSRFEGASPVQALFAFRDALSVQTSDSVDRFIRDNPRFNLIGKILLASKIISNMYDYREGAYKLKNFSARSCGNRRNWYHLLINELHEPFRNIATHDIPNVYVVTFNYDHSLERALYSLLGKTDAHGSRKCSYQSPEIMHVNGSLRKLDDDVSDVAAYVCKFAKEIHLVDEDVDEQISDVRRMASEVISCSEKIFIFGFAFDEANVHTIGLHQVLDKRSLYCHNFDGNIGVTSTFKKLTRNMGYIMAGRREAPIHIDEAIDYGFLKS